jgi:hypothetical protein
VSKLFRKTEDGSRKTEVRKKESSDFGLQTSDFKRSLGDYSGGVPPLPIPNREVKPASADGTALWESRSSPTLIKGFSQKLDPFCFVYLKKN